MAVLSGINLEEERVGRDSNSVQRRAITIGWLEEWLIWLHGSSKSDLKGEQKIGFNLLRFCAEAADFLGILPGNNLEEERDSNQSGDALRQQISWLFCQALTWKKKELEEIQIHSPETR